MNTNEHEYDFRSDKLFGCHFLAPIREYSCSFVAKILSRAGQQPQTTKSVSARKVLSIRNPQSAIRNPQSALPNYANLGFALSGSISRSRIAWFTTSVFI